MPHPPKLPSVRPTDHATWLNRRSFLRKAALVTAGGTGSYLGLRELAEVSALEPIPGPDALKVPLRRPDVFPAKANPRFPLPAGVTLTPRRVAATHNNFYEFLPGRGGPVYKHTGRFVVDPWKVEVGGACAAPRTFDLDDLFRLPHEERVYHFRCVETWAMNVPWTGLPLSRLLDAVKPLSSAKFVKFISANVPEQMPGVGAAPWFKWPYYEALRMDEAMNELTLLATGVYGEPLLKQHGSPVRLVVPWKYGYKSPKSIVRIELTEAAPGSFWSDAQPREYGFLSNVNPNTPHPRWSQATEYLLEHGRARRTETRLFNGYEEFVGGMYPDEPRSPLSKAPRTPL